MQLWRPLRERRAEIAAQPGRAIEILREGTARARAISQETLELVQERMGLRAGEVLGPAPLAI